MDIYKKQGFKDRKDYLHSLADDYSVPLTVVMSLAELLGENEDFDGLISELQDYADDMEEEFDRGEF